MDAFKETLSDVYEEMCSDEVASNCYFILDHASRKGIQHQFVQEIRNGLEKRDQEVKKFDIKYILLKLREMMIESENYELSQLVMDMYDHLEEIDFPTQALVSNVVSKIFSEKLSDVLKEFNSPRFKEYIRDRVMNELDFTMTDFDKICEQEINEKIDSLRDLKWVSQEDSFG